MKNHIKTLEIFPFVILLVFIFFSYIFTSFASDLNKGQIIVITVDGHFEHFNVECAISNSEKTKGLMFRKELDKDEGMLFIWKEDGLRQFWMKNTLMNLDILFINSEYKIVNIEERAQSGSTRIISSKFPVKYVLEIKAGQSQIRNITLGATLSLKKLYNRC